jgi:predicted CopG family antitoxin
MTMSHNPAKLEWLLASDPIEPLIHGRLKRTLEILDELEQREPLEIEQLVSEDERREKIES